MPAHDRTNRARVLLALSLELLDQHAEVGDAGTQAALDAAVERLAERLLMAADALSIPCDAP